MITSLELLELVELCNKINIDFENIDKNIRYKDIVATMSAHLFNYFWDGTDQVLCSYLCQRRCKKCVFQVKNNVGKLECYFDDEFSMDITVSEDDVKRLKKLLCKYKSKR